MTTPRSIIRFAILSGAAATALSTSARGQVEATTLAALTDRADGIAIVRALGRDDTGARRRVTLRTTRWLLDPSATGAPAPASRRIELDEANTGSRRACGTALFGVLPGAGYLAFLTHRPTGWSLAAASGRSLVRLDPSILAHVRGLVTTRQEPASRLALLTSALRGDNRRVTRDAALSLARLPNLGGASDVDRARIVAGLRVQLDQDPVAVSSLLIAARRTRATGVIDVLLPPWLDGTHAALAPMIESTLLAFDAERLAGRVLGVRLDSPDRRRRAVALLGTLPGRSSPAVRGALEQLLGARESDVRVAAARSLLAAGVTSRDLAGRVSAAELGRASQPVRPSRIRRYRAINPRRLR